ncbi:MAG: riboflavin synthase subunit alpha [Synechocystis sp.]|nr:riboflavin synthase subunit alpha [Synechocystis sp.]
MSAFLYLNIQEEAIRASLGCVAILSILVTLFLGPWALKLTLVAVPFGLERFYRFSQPSSID